MSMSATSAAATELREVPKEKKRKKREPLEQGSTEERVNDLAKKWLECRVEDSDKFLNVQPEEAIVDALRRMDPKLITKKAGKTGFWTRYTVLEGQIGLGTLHGRTLFFPAGNYRRIGVGCELNKIVDLQKNGVDEPIRNGDVTILQLAENQVAVVQIGPEQKIISAGRYIIRSPNSLEGKIVDIKNLRLEDKATTKSEIAKTSRGKHGELIVEDEISTKEVTAGYRDEAGSYTFLRPAPGYRYAIQMADGGYRIGKEFTVAEGQERFVTWLDYQDYSRTTRELTFRSHDSQELSLKVQISWKLKDGATWLGSGGTYDDPFDYLEEKVQALFRDGIGAKSHEEIQDEQKNGFEGIEKKIRPELVAFAERLGVELVGMEVRSLRFPEHEKRRIKMAEFEAKREHERLGLEKELDQQKLQNKKKADKETADQERAQQAAEKQALLQSVDDDRKLAAVEAENAQSAARLNAQKEQEQIRAETARLKALGDAEAQAAGEERMARARLEAAKLDAQAKLEAERAVNEAYIARAKAEAEAARELGEALKGHPELLELRKAEAYAEVLKAFAHNPDALLSDEMRRDILRMRGVYQPEFPPGYKQATVAKKD